MFRRGSGQGGDGVVVRSTKSKVLLLIRGLPAAIFALGCSTQGPIFIQNHEHGLASRPIQSLEQYSERDADGLRRMTRFPRQCAPYSPPIRAMNREKLFVIQGTVYGRVVANGRVEFRGVRGDIPASVLADVETHWREALTAAPCQVDAIIEPHQFDMPFKFVLNN